MKIEERSVRKQKKNTTKKNDQRLREPEARRERSFCFFQQIFLDVRREGVLFSTWETTTRIHGNNNNNNKNNRQQQQQQQQKQARIDFVVY